MWLGYLEEYPDYMTQGALIDELQYNLKDIYKELNSGTIPQCFVKLQNSRFLEKARPNEKRT